MDKAYLIKLPYKQGVYCLKNGNIILSYFQVSRIDEDGQNYAISRYERIDANKIEDNPEPIYYNREDEYFYEATGTFFKLNGSSLQEKIMEYADKSINYNRLQKIKIYNCLSD